jgi:hydrogenase maturation protease
MILTETNDPARLIEAWKGANTTIIIDAMCSGTEPGTIRRFDARAEHIPRGLLRYSTHSFGVADAIELARALDALPRVIIYGIEGRRFEAGAGLSAEAEKAVGHAVELVLGELQTEA